LVLALKLIYHLEQEKNLDTSCTVQDLQDWEERHGKIPSHSVVLLYTGQGEFYNDENKYYGKDEGSPQNNSDIHFPGFSPEAAQWLVDNRDIAGVGLDTPSLDSGKEKQFLSHQILLGAGKWGIENVANMHRLPPSGYTIFNMVFKLYDGSGAPTRVFATFGTHDFSRSSVVHSAPALSFLTALVTIYILLI